MKNLKSMVFGVTAATTLMLGAGMASANNVVTVNAVQIFGTVDPAKIKD
jgi:peptide/nickel transport system substrate-binding protein